MEELGCYMTTKILLKSLVPVGVLLALTTVASATITPADGSFQTPDTQTVAGDTFDTSTSGTAFNGATIGTSSLIVDYTESVWTEVGGSCPGCIDFEITATNRSASTITVESISTGSFAGLPSANGLNIGDNGATSSTVVAPNADSRSNFGTDQGATAKFYFNSTPLAPGDSTVNLVIKTTALTYTAGTLAFQDGVSANGAGYGVAPEPNMACLLSVLAVGILGVAYRRKKNVVKNTEV